MTDKNLKLVDLIPPLFFSQTKSDPQLSPEAQRLLEAVLAPSSQSSAAAVPSSPSAVLDFESGQVLGQLPFEYSSFLDLPPAAFGKKTNRSGHIYARTHAHTLCGCAGQQDLMGGLVLRVQKAEGCRVPVPTGTEQADGACIDVITPGGPASNGGTREQVDVSG